MRGRRVVAGLAVLTFLMAGAPVAGAQDDPFGRVTTCKPSECDPVAANGGKVVEAGPVRVILYGHFQDLIQHAALDTRPPTGEEDVNQGFIAPTLITRSKTAGDVHFANNRFTMISTAVPGPFDNEDRGYAQPAAYSFNWTISGDTIWGYWYVSPNALWSAPSGGDPPSAGIMPAVGVAMRLETGHASGHGMLIAEGDTGLGTVGEPTDPTATTTLIRLPNGDWVYELKVPMHVRVDTVPAGTGLIATATVYQARSDAAEATQTGWRLRTGETFPPRIVLDVVEPVQTDSGRVVRDGNTLRFLWSIRALAGPFDVDLASVGLSLSGPQEVSEPELELVKFQFQPRTGSQSKPLEVHWQYSSNQPRLADGEYTLRGEALNRQGTYRAVWSDTFTVKGGKALVAEDGGNAAGVELAVVLMATLAAVAFARGRRT